MSRNGNCDAKRHGNASAGTMVRLKLVFAARMCLQAVLDLFCMSSSCISWTLYQTYLKKQTKAGHERGQNEVRTRYQTRSKTTRDRPLPVPGRDTHREIKEHRMAHTHPRAKTTYMTNPKCLNVIHHNILHTISCYSIIFEPYQSSQTYMLRKKKATHGRHTSKHRNNIHNLSNMLYHDAPQYAFPQGRRSSATT